MAERERDVVIYDGQCAVCSAFKEGAEQRDREGRLRFVPFQSDEMEALAPEVSRKTARRALVVRRADGRVFVGARAVFETMRREGGLRGLAGRVLSFPPIALAAEPLYRLLAPHRGRFARFVKR